MRRPVRALLASESIGEVIVLAQQPERIAEVLTDEVVVRPSGDTIASGR